MSGIIWGYIDLKKNKQDYSAVNNKMMHPMEKYKIDNYKFINEDNYLIGCGLQYITEESFNEEIPFKDSEDDLVLTADAIIDNREELLNLLGLENYDVSHFTDSQYILMSYKKWGKDCCKYLIGDYTFAIVDKRKEEIYLARDHVGKRTLYYYFKDNTLIFSTLINPILEVIQPQLNEEQLVEYLSIEGVLTSVNTKETMYKDIYKLEPSTYMIIKDNKKTIANYWDWKNNIKTIKLKNDSEYEKKFLEVFSECVNCRLRSSGNVGIMLSSGLDSGSVFSIAAEILQEKNKNIFTYTSIPLDKNKHLKVKNRVVDESEGVKLITGKYNNVVSKFCDFKDESTISRLKENIDTLEMPYKAIENIYWYKGIAENASNDGCKILLDGQFGNSTVSYGEYYTKLVTLIRNWDIAGIIKENIGLKRLYNLSLKTCIKDTVKVTKIYSLLKRIKHRNHIEDNIEDVLSTVNIDLYKKWNIRKRLDDTKVECSSYTYCDWDEVRKLIINPVTLSHISEYETKISLKTGLLKRDATRDKRLIELLLSYPIDQFVRNGKERYLVKRAFKGRIPDDILEGRLRRGIQGADWIERLRDSWDHTYTDILNILDDETAMKYINKDKLCSYIDKFRNLPESYDDMEKYQLRTLMNTYIFYKYIKEFEDYNY